MKMKRAIWKSLPAIPLLLFAAATQAGEISYNYVEADYISADLDFSERVTDTGVDARLSTGDDDGFRIGGAWNIYGNWHVFGDYSNADQDVDASGNVGGVDLSASGDFEITRWRAGVGYAWPVNDRWSLYGRVSYDAIEFEDFSFAGADVQIDDTDDDGLGAEAGARWLVADPFELQGWVRYTSVGDVDVDNDDAFDEDLLVGLGARWNINERFGVQAGYETGEIDTWNIGARVSL